MKGEETSMPDLRAATIEDLRILMDWFHDAAGTAQWGGPDFRFPFDSESFQADCHWPEMPSYVLADADGRMIGFGQFYLKLGRVHLARLAVAPGAQGRGHGKRLVEALCAVGRAELGGDEASLYVLESNAPARACYRAVGFVDSPEMPDPDMPPDTLFMIRRL